MSFFDFLKNKPKEAEPNDSRVFINKGNKVESDINEMMKDLDDLISEIDRQIAERDAKEVERV